MWLGLGGGGVGERVHFGGDAVGHGHKLDEEEVETGGGEEGRGWVGGVVGGHNGFEGHDEGGCPGAGGSLVSREGVGVAMEGGFGSARVRSEELGIS